MVVPIQSKEKFSKRLAGVFLWIFAAYLFYIVEHAKFDFGGAKLVDFEREGEKPTAKKFEGS